MDFKTFTPGEVFTADDANNLMSGGRIVVDTASQLPTGSGVPDRLRAIARDTGRTYTFIGTSLHWQPDDVGTGWIAVELTNGWTSIGEAPVGVRKINGVVYIRGQVTAGTAVSTFVLPEGFKPSAEMRLAVRSATASSVDYLSVRSSGGVWCTVGSSPDLSGIPPYPAQ